MAKGVARRPRLPLLPLLAQYRADPQNSPGAGAHRCALNPQHLDDADDVLAGQLERFAASVLPVCWRLAIFRERTRLIRHSLAHLFRGADPLAERFARCVTPGAAYHVPGLGLTFWAAVATAVDPGTVPIWCPAVERGLQALGLFPDKPHGVADRLAATVEGCERIRAASPGLTIAQTVDFLERVSRMPGRELPSKSSAPGALAWTVGPERIRHAVREVRTARPLRQRIRDASSETLEAIARFKSFAGTGECEKALEAYRSAFQDAVREAELQRLDDAFSMAIPDWPRLWCDLAASLRERFRVHPLELADVVAAAGRPPDQPAPLVYSGFCADTFAFLSQLEQNNSRAWMNDNRGRYQFVVREPLIDLCSTLAARYIAPVLNREYGWDMEIVSRNGKALTSICKNDFGRGDPYQVVQWLTFFRRCQENRRADAQFFVRLASDGVRCGFHLGRRAREAGNRFRRTVQEHGDALFAALANGGGLARCRFWVGDELDGEVPIQSAADLRAWAVNKTIAAGVLFDAADPVLRGDDLPGEVLLTFDRLVPLFASAAEQDPRPLLARSAGNAVPPCAYDAAAFHRETFLSEAWLDRVLQLLRLKQQLILHGVPGTGKTHVARRLARLLANDRPESVRLVQFHPAYSYEEFVEGIRVRNVEVEGRSEVVYPVENGVLSDFAAQALAHPSKPHVLVIDELNRGNLPRIFGELLFLLEYRDQEVVLPYSKRAFRLPGNLFVVATMNPLDRTAIPLDQAMRRRFSFVEMRADAAILASWLEQNCGSDPTKEAFARRVVLLFEELNRRLARDLGPDKQVGHSFFMIGELDAEKLAAVWDHHVRPLLHDYVGGREERLKDYTPDRLLNGRPAKGASAASGAGNG